jgi:hypothetical protein
LLLDEPQLTVPRGATGGTWVRSPVDLLRWCQALHAKGTTILLAMSPAEWVALRRMGEPGNLVSSRDLRVLPPLTEQQARRLARTGWAKMIFSRVPEAWRKRPFLLELFFQFVEEELGGEAPDGELSELLQRVREWSESERFGYFRTVFWNGLDDEQRDVLRRVARREPVEPKDVELLQQCSILDKDGTDHAVGDPILAVDLYPLRIHHVSDIHFGPKAAGRVDVKARGDHADAMALSLGPKHVADHYVEHLRELHARGQGPHVVIISGDIAEWATEGEYTLARAWLSAVAALLVQHPRLSPDARHVLVAGGNHDVDWSATDGPAGYRKRHLAFARALDDIPRSLRTRLEDHPRERALPVARYTDLGVEVVPLGSSELGGEPERDPAREAMLDFVEGLRSRARALSAEDAERAETLHTKVLSRIDPGLVHEQDLQRLRRAQPRHPVRIAVLHHPVSPLPYTEVARFVGLLNAGEVKDALIESEVCLVLHGHAHVGWFGQEQWPERESSRGWVLRIAAAPSLGSREINEQNGYNEVTIAREPGETRNAPYTIVAQRVVRKGATWERTKAMGPFAPGE